MAYVTVDEYKAAYPGTSRTDGELAGILEEASGAMDGEMDAAGIPHDGPDSAFAATLRRICLKVAHRADGNEDFDGVPYGTTQMNASGGSYSRGYSFGSEGFGDVFLTRSEKLQLGIGRPRACVVSPYGRCR